MHRHIATALLIVFVMTIPAGAVSFTEGPTAERSGDSVTV
jgi:hypothetical protein